MKLPITKLFIARLFLFVLVLATMPVFSDNVPEYGQSNNVLFSQNMNDLSARIVLATSYQQGKAIESTTAYVLQSDRYNGYVVVPDGFVRNRDRFRIRIDDKNSVLPAQVMAVESNLGMAILKVNGLSTSSFSFALNQLSVGDAVKMILRDPSSFNIVESIGEVQDINGSEIHHSANMGIYNIDGNASNLILLNRCNEIVGFFNPSSDSKQQFTPARKVQSWLARRNLLPSVSKQNCLSDLALAKAAAVSAQAAAERTRLEAVAAQQKVKSLSSQLSLTKQKNSSLVDQLRQTKQRSQQALIFAQEAEQKAMETQAILEQETLTSSADSEAIVKHLEGDRIAAEQRFTAALLEQRAAASSRERLLMSVFGLFALLLVILAVVFIRANGGVLRDKPHHGQSTFAENRSENQAKSHRQKTILHNENEVEYVLDGRDEDGIRYLLRISGDQLTGQDGIIIGRNPKDSPYIINHADVSRKHARLKLMKDRAFIEDLGSTNGTSVNGQTIDAKGPVSVASGDQIIIGSVVMKLRVLNGAR